jgi:ABC-type Fe3+ transport system permease subunit
MGVATRFKISLGRWVHGLGRVSGALAWAVVLAPLPALVAAAAFDHGPGPADAVRPALFPAALAALDPFVWECVRNSLVTATAVTLAARFVGVGLARAVARRRFWGRRPLAALACAELAVPPAFAALGLRGALGGAGGWDGLSAWTWGAWFWAALAGTMPLVMLTAATALEGVEPGWEDAARLAGASRARAWRQLVWPVIRPDVARALGAVFTLTLLEPGAPLVLGLRRTLGFQIVASALDAPSPGQLTRAAVLALAGAALAAAVRALLGWWGGDGPALATEPASTSAAHTPAVSWARASGFVAALTTAAALAGFPALALIGGSLAPAGAGSSSGSARWSLAAYADIAGDPLTRRYLLNAAALGLAVAGLDVVLARAAVSLASTRRVWARRWLAGLADWPEAVPPLALGVGTLALPAVLTMAADALGSGGPSSWSRPLADVLRSVADLFDLDRTPGVALWLAVAAVRAPLVARSAVARRKHLRPAPIDAAVVFGATPRRARRRLAGGWLGVSPAAALLTFTLATTSVTPALILAPTAETRPLGPAVLALADEPGGTSRAAALAAVAVGLNLVALAFAARERPELTRAWLRADRERWEG